MGDHGSLLRTVYLCNGTVTIDGRVHALRDARLATLDSERPNVLSREEQRCLDRLEQSFLESPRLWRHTRLVREAAGCSSRAITT